MPFDPLPISLYPLREEGGVLVVEWASTAPAESWYQVYVDGSLAWWGPSTVAEIPTPQAAARIDVGAVGAGEAEVDFSASIISASPPDSASLSWLGGRYLAPDLAGFRVYGEPSPGAGVDYSTPVADLSAYVGGVHTDGWGMGGWGSGGWGSIASRYGWTSRPLASGTWTFAVRPYDDAGNEGPPMTTTVAVVAPPPPPPINPAVGNARMWYTYDPVTRVATLHWLPVIE